MGMVRLKNGAAPTTWSAPRQGPGHRLMVRRHAESHTDDRFAGAAPRPARVPRGLGCLRPKQPRAPSGGAAARTRTGVGLLGGRQPQTYPDRVWSAPGRVQEANAARPAQELARRAGEPVAADRAHIHRQLAHALRARAAPRLRAGADTVQHAPRPDRCFLSQRPRFTPQGPARPGNQTRWRLLGCECMLHAGFECTLHAASLSKDPLTPNSRPGAARRAAARLAAGPRGRASARLAGVQEEGNAVPPRDRAHDSRIVDAPAAARRAVRVSRPPAPLTALLAGCRARA
jgi:hypothetical protein